MSTALRSPARNWLTCIFFAGTAALDPRAVIAQDRSTRVATIIVRSGILLGADRNAENFEAMLVRSRDQFNNSVPAERQVELVVQPMAIDDTTTKRQVLDLIDATEVNARTTLVFYYTGHGGVFPNRGEDAKNRQGEHYLILDRNSPDYLLGRTELRDRLLGRHPRLLVILTDCCTTLMFAPTRRPGGLPAPKPDLFEELFLLPSDVVDINSSSYRIDEATGAFSDEASWYNKAGGVFSRAFFDLYGDRAAAAQPGRKVTWKSLVPALRTRTNDAYKILRNSIVDDPGRFALLRAADPTTAELLGKQTEQNPMVFRLPDE
jgi:hypothetical protein